MFHKISQRKRTKDIKNILYSRYYRALEDIKNKRPRLYIDKKQIEFLKTRLDIYPYSKFWNYIQYLADIYCNQTPPEDLSGYDDNTVRGLGNKLYYLSAAYVLTDDTKYLDGAKKWMDALCTYPDWCSNEDLGAAHILFGMSICYDWLYDLFTEEDRLKYRNKMRHHANIFYDLLYNKDIWWAENYLQNHNYVNTTALAITGIVLYDEVEETVKWLYIAKKNFDIVLRVLSPDAASLEGCPYWGYGLEALLRYFIAMEKVFGWKYYLNHNFFYKAWFYRLHMSTPNFVEVINYADSSTYDWHGPGYMLRGLGREYDNGGIGNWLSEELETVANEAGRSSPHTQWFDIFWYDERKLPYFSKKLSTFAYFNDLDIVVNRKSWDRYDTTNYLQFFKCGYPSGKLAKQKSIEKGSGHVHPDEGNFLLWAYGKWLIVDEGYTYNKQSLDHNIIVPNGQCQLGGDRRWFSTSEVQNNNGDAKIIFISNKFNYKYIVGDATNIYPAGADLASWVRTIIFLPKGYLVVRDDVQLNSNGYVDSYLHFNIDGELTDEEDYFLFSVDDVRLEVYDALGIPSTSTINREFKNYLVHGNGRDDLYLKQTFTDIQSYIHVRILRPYSINLTSPGQFNIKQSNENVLEFEDDYLSVMIDFNNKNANVFEKIIF